ncbi:MAG: GNAT family N-acetyltransferase [Bacilli bacterium]|nr:GNAT family N-acetyltransferase [Bacilli bacterium]
MDSWTIVVAKESDYAGVVSCFSSALETQEEGAKIEEERRNWILDGLLEEIRSGSVYVMKSRRGVIGFATVSHSMEDEFFPLSHRYSKSNVILEEMGYRGEPLTIIKALFIEAAHQRKGLGDEFLHSLFARYKNSSFALYLEEGNVEAKQFFLNHGFFPCGHGETIERGKGPKLILAKRYRPMGLCREPRW